MSYSYRADHLLAGVSLEQPNGPPLTVGLGYDCGDRLTNVTSLAGAFGYAWSGANGATGPGGLIQRVTLPNGAVVTNGYDGLGRLLAARLNGGSLLDAHDYAYNLAHQVTNQARVDGSWVAYTYDDVGRLRTATGRESGGAVRLNEKLGWDYDTAGNLAFRTNNALVEGFAADGLNRLTQVSRSVKGSVVNTVSFQAGTTRMTTTKQFDALKRLQSINSVSADSGAVPISYAYHYNQASQRDNVVLGDGSYWLYDYDSLGQVKSGKRYWRDGTVVAGQQFEYSFDDIGNRATAKAGGDDNWANLRSAAYTANSLNQYSQRTVPRAFDVLGLANNAATVTVNDLAAYRKGEYSRKEVTVATGANPAYTTVTSKSVLTPYPDQIQTGQIFTPRTPEVFTHDLDGNLTPDGLWDYAWDGENRLVQMTTRTDVTVAPARRIEFAYDWQGRRIGKKVYDVRTGGTLLSTARFLYDGWNLLAELDASNNKVRTFMWGLDLSGTSQGAGGVGGLLKVTYYGATTTNAFVAYDGNRNVMGLLDAATTNWVARYEYGPFGELLRASGPMAKANPFRFSTKYQDDETDLVYYGYRYYSASTGRWLSRDPIDDLTPGFPNTANLSQKRPANTVCFASNDGLNWFDSDGRKAAQANPGAGGSARTPKFVKRVVRPATPPFPRCVGACGYACIGILFDVTITDASGIPIPGLPTTESIIIVGDNCYFSFTPTTGTATTDNKGMFPDVYKACFYCPRGFATVQQTISAGGLKATWNATLYISPCNCTGNLRTVFQ